MSITLCDQKIWHCASKIDNNNQSQIPAPNAKFSTIDKKTADIWMSGLKNLNNCVADRIDYNKLRQINEQKYPALMEKHALLRKKEREELVSAKDDFLDLDRKEIPASLPWKMAKSDWPSVYIRVLDKIIDNYTWSEKTLEHLLTCLAVMEQAGHHSTELSRLMEDLPEDEQNLLFLRYINENERLMNPQYGPDFIAIRKRCDYDVRRVRDPNKTPEENEQLRNVEREKLIRHKDDFLDLDHQEVSGYLPWRMVEDYSPFLISCYNLKKIIKNYSWNEQTLDHLSRLLMEVEQGCHPSTQLSEYMKNLPKEEQDRFSRWLIANKPEQYPETELSVLMKGLPEKEQNLLFQRYVNENNKMKGQYKPDFIGTRKSSDYDDRRVKSPDPKPEVDETIKDENLPAYFNLTFKELREENNLEG